MKTVAVILVVLVALVLVTEGRKRGGKHHPHPHHHRNHHRNQFNCTNRQCYQPCELLNCIEGQVCVEHEKSCQSSANTALNYTQAKCEKVSHCNCTNVQVCRRKHKALKEVGTHCRPIISEPKAVLAPSCRTKVHSRKPMGVRRQRGHKGERWSEHKRRHNGRQWRGRGKREE